MSTKDYYVKNTIELHDTVKLINFDQNEKINLYLYPGVYKASGTKTDIGLLIKHDNLNIIGLGNESDEVCIIDNRGHMINAFPLLNEKSSLAHTMMVIGNNIIFKNLSIINYCNRNFKYIYDESLNEDKYSNVITQAYALGGIGKNFKFYNCNILGMLDTLSLRVENTYFKDCYIEGTNDFIGSQGIEIYENSTFLTYGACPMWSAASEITLFKNCIFNTKIKDSKTLFLTKHGGLIVLEDVKYYGDIINIEWSLETSEESICYQKNVSLNNKSILIGSNDFNRIIYEENIFDITKLLNNDLVYKIKCDNYVNLNYNEEKELHLNVNKLDYSYIGPMSVKIKDSVLTIKNENKDLKDTKGIITLKFGVITKRIIINLKVKLVIQPNFILNPYFIYKDDAIKIDYKIEGMDNSIISWYRDDDLILTSDNERCDVYKLSMQDNNKKIKCRIYPMNYNSLKEKYVELISTELKYTKHDIKIEDFKYYNLLNNEYKTNQIIFQTFMPSYDKLDSNVSLWEKGESQDAFKYMKGMDALVYDYGLLTNARGATIIYTPPLNYNGMEVNIVIAPEKKSGSGFGSANGQYVEVFVNYDYITESGYAIRIERTIKEANSCAITIRKYLNGINQIISDEIITNIFINETYINLKILNNQIIAKISSLKTFDDLNDNRLISLDKIILDVAQMPFMGFKFLHTGTISKGNRTMIKRLNIEYFN